MCLIIEQAKLVITVEKTKQAEELMFVDNPKRFKEYDSRLKEIVRKNDEWKTRLENHILKLKGLLKAGKEVCAPPAASFSATRDATPSADQRGDFFCLHASTK